MKRFFVVFLMFILVLNLCTSKGSVYATSETGEGTKVEEKKEADDTTTTNEPVKQTDTKSSDVVTGANIDITSKAAVLIEGSTGEIIYAKNKDERLRPASITKIMTLLLIFEAIDSGRISLTDEVSVSEHAASMGGSQVYLEPFETQTVDTMIKCISICSANDACTAMAEFIGGSEEEFVARMNDKAKELGMNNTHFVNCCGLDVDNHYSTAYDVALMSQALIMKHPEIQNYSTVWMDTITHVTRRGQSEFGLSNTNKLIKTYNGITGLKTGSTSLAKYCLSATAKRNGMDMIAVIMAAPETKVRFQEAAKLLDYGFANCSMYQDNHEDFVVNPITVTRGVQDNITYKPAKNFSYVCFKDKKPENVTKEITINPQVKAPINENDKVGEINYYYNGEKIGSVDLVSEQTVQKAKFGNYLGKTMKHFLMH